MNDEDVEFYAEVFFYLDGLRETGVTNMYGAAPYVEREFNVDRKEAREALQAWMATFDPNMPPLDRALSLSGK